MESIIEIGIMIIQSLQKLGTWLVLPMQAISSLNNQEFFMFVAPAIYWCLDASLGLRMSLGLLLSAISNSAFKLAFHGPRPYWLDTTIKAYSTQLDFGVPSGHSQNATVVWGLLAKAVHKGWVWLLVLVFIFLMGFSRMYLGVHFPHDVLIGWLLGAVILWAIIKFEKPFLSWFNHFRTADQILIAFGSSLVMILVVAFIRLFLDDWVLPESWVLTAALASPAAEPINPLALSGVISNAGTFFGLVLGAIWLREWGWFDASGPLWQRLLRFLIGILGIAILWFGLGELFPRGEALLPYLLRYTRYALVGLWTAGIAPMIFIRLKIAGKAN